MKTFAVLASGQGSTLDFLLKKQKDGGLNPRVVCVVTDNPLSGAIQVAKHHQLAVECVDRNQHQSLAQWDEALCAKLKQHSPSFILLAGFLKKIGPKVLKAFDGRIINTHPSLLPKYGGKGMYGSKVHGAVIAAGDKESGVSIHLVNENYDEGRILKQVRVPIKPGESAAELEERVKALEKQTLLAFLNTW